VSIQSAELHQALSHYFGFEAFRPGQEAIVQSIADRRNTLAIMPTGGGKSLCYQLPALVLDGVTLVISPLIALMKDQVDALTAREIPATFINSSLPGAEQNARIRGMSNGTYKLVYVAPERFRHRRFVEELKRVQISFVAVDEAHCVSQWGHDFRPDYLRVGEGIEMIGRPPVSAFTATATPEVRADIERFLDLKDPAIFITGFGRPNLNFEVREVSKQAEKFAALSRLIGKHKTGIIYCATRKRVEAVSEHLAEWDITHIAYHGGLDDSTREELQNEFINKRVDVAVATNAFGMGIDRADLRFVAHFEIPGSVEAFYQEAGRAGRDGLPSQCVLLYNYADRRTQDFFIDGANPSAEFIRSVYRQLLDLADSAHEVRLSIQDLSEAIGSKNGMAVGAALKALGDLGLLERFDIPGERIRGTRLLKPDVLPFKVELDEAALVEKERRDRSKLDSVITFATARECRQIWIRRYFGEEDPEPCHHCDVCRGTTDADIRSLNEEETLLVRKLLSGVARMSERSGNDWVGRFGKGLIIKMLMGSQDQKIEQFGLNQLSTFGILSSVGAPFVRELWEACLRAGYVFSSGGSRPVITLTSMGAAVMYGKVEPEMSWPARTGNLTTPKSRMRTGLGADAVNGEVDPELMEALRNKRAELARARGGVPAYTILTNRSLEALACHRPKTADEARLLPGIGPAKAKRVVPTFLKVIEAYEGS
jgi:ATP-dependent DNA helicase RecQ